MEPKQVADFLSISPWEVAITAGLTNSFYLFITLVVCFGILRGLDWLSDVQWGKDVLQKMEENPMALAVYYGIRFFGVAYLGAAFIK